MQMSCFTVIVPAAGVGKRMGAGKPKQYLALAGKTLLEHTLENLISHPRIERIVLALHPQDPYFDELPVADAPWITRVQGGKERADSVLAGLQALSDQDWVLVHDAARPCLSHGDLDKLLLLSEGAVGGILATPVRDTMKRADAYRMVARTEDRSNLWHALTPQFFPAKALTDALQNALTQGVNITDEASAMEWANHPVHLVEGCSSNIKVTRPEDLALAEFYLKQKFREAS
ncbi:2-C-methyl-D-erythritol 4-phosphate cytidylyltransferase [Aliiglaciecola sp. CAU 1673]|uniref:2-C-methyl-D-erythritol 4-phosphate cytidylyltransferase n=1 Tax=Aliiglaciecola sp. CAU 1673 TaxID=3032595 RepID=UPI0023D9CBFF|nr:2-C-methyl-D-erythritol 4-phosphate cytidylyltransferase [Aliiglaciecola sp. CAU 1673]MDF2178976.1 2-C-methyl-D-erythritol 4-phosphate cytidylyltransferase [Aliiglaciecola sp. CAU 1673]